MYFNRAVNIRGAGLGVVLITLEGEMLSMAKRLDIKVTNNMVEYEVCLFGLEVVVVARARHLMIYGDSVLVIQQALEEWESLVTFNETFGDREIRYALLSREWGNANSNGTRGKAMVYDMKRFIESREYPEEAAAKERYALLIQASNYISHEGVLYRRMVSGVQF
ncbi:uncharacterized protein LOC107260807 [Ricinus communis]|uniref:uncharacterized protein LOC107260807 n=1 Tax=Ricinus communis TaxID=3988 RepID=UPI000772266B|nr:uncharacterized protein LOC107260807 [Ricinus communis]|eukprot:XP_015571011.1 uncharacterized protein LOC107260807 [Ricinus communis]